MSSADDHLLAGAYALGALDQAGQIDFEIHLARCPACRAEVAGLTETAALLAAAAPAPVGEPLFDRVMAEVRETSQLPPLPRNRLADPRPAPTPRNGQARPPSRSPRPATNRSVWWLAAAAAVAVVVVAGSVVARLAAERSPGGGVAAVVDDPATRHTALHGDGPGDVSVLVQPDSGRAVVDARLMPSLEPGQTYELWFIAGGLPHRAVTFAPDGSGAAQVAFLSPVTEPDAFGVTVEPASGSDAPTSPVLLQGRA